MAHTTPTSKMSLLSPSGAEQVRKAAMRDDIALRGEYLFAPPAAVARLLTPLLTDQRDLPILYLYLNIALLVVPSAAAIHLLGCTSHLAGAAYFIGTYVLFLQRFMLALHYSEHRRLFRTGLGALNWVAPLLFAPLFGVPSGMYRVHHCVMHHVGNNRAGADASATEQWHRANPAHFFIYWMRHAVLGWIEVPARAAYYRRWGILVACLVTEAAYLGVVAVLWRMNQVATTWTLVVPFAVSSFALMFGNWSQHIFINPASPRSNHSLAYDCVGCSDNRRSFNDGYHIVHHCNSKLHWSEMPRKLIASLEDHAARDALIFLDIGFFEVGAAVFARQFGFLARHLARYSAKFSGMSDAEIIDMLKERLKPVRM